MSLALARALVVSELVSRARMGQFLARAVRQGRSLAVVLAEEHEELVLAALAKDPTPLIPELEIDRDLLTRLPPELPERLGVAPLVGYSAANLVALAMMDPSDRIAAMEVERLLGMSIMRVRVRPLLLRKALLLALSEAPSPSPSLPVSQPAVTLRDQGPPLSVPTDRPPHPAALLPGEFRFPHSLGQVVPSMRPRIQTPPFGSRSLPSSYFETAGRSLSEAPEAPRVALVPTDDEGDDDEPVLLVRRASQRPTGTPAPLPSSPSPHPHTLAPPPPTLSPPPPSVRVSVLPPPPAQRRATSQFPSVLPPPSQDWRTARSPSRQPPAPLSVPPPASVRPRRSVTPTAISSHGLHSFSRMSIDEYATRLDMLRSAKHRDDVTGEMLTLGHSVADRVIIFASRGERYLGWSASVSLGKIRELEISARELSVFSRAAQEDGYLGPLTPSGVHRELFTRLCAPTPAALASPLEVAVWPVLLQKRPALFLLATQLTDPLVATQRFAEICGAAGAALLRLLRAK